MSKVLIINGPNINLLGEREQSQYGNKSYKYLEEICNDKSKDLKIDLDIKQSNIEGDIVNMIQDARKNYNAIIINAGGYTHTSVAIRDALDVFKKPVLELHISNIYKREEFRQKSLISGVVTGGIFGFGINGYILAIEAIQEIINNGNW